MVRFHCRIPSAIAGNFRQTILFKPRLALALKSRRYLAKIMERGKSTDH